MKGLVLLQKSFEVLGGNFFSFDNIMQKVTVNLLVKMAICSL